MNSSISNSPDEANASADGNVDVADLADSSGVSEEQAETVVTAAFSQVLTLAEVNPDAPFAALGGDSLRAVRVLSRVWRELGIELPVHSLRPSTTAAELAEIIQTYGQAS